VVVKVTTSPVTKELVAAIEAFAFVKVAVAVPIATGV
jgi:hypothetical protein